MNNNSYKSRYINAWLFHLIIWTLIPTILFGQNETDNWYFGNKSALNFSNCNPAIVSGSQINTIEGCASISDSHGTLLFYTDGIKVWDRNSTLMTNGTGLFGDPSSTQSGVIIPQPGNDSIYYILTVDSELGSKGLCYSVVNIKRNGGLGEVLIKNVNILASANEKLTAIRHFNKKDIWVITRQFFSDKYYAWLLTESGISVNPTISSTSNYIGSVINTSRGYLKPSSDGSKLASAYNDFSYLELSSFNNQTGKVTNTIKLNSRPAFIRRAGNASPYGIEFSPDNKLMYISTRLDFTENCSTCLDVNYYISQYKVSVFDSTTISNSVVLIDSGGTVSHPGYTQYAALQLAKDGKIYVAQYFQNSLSVISSPNNIGIGCTFQKNALNLGLGQSTGGLPTFIQSYFDPNFRSYDYSFVEDCSKMLTFSFSTGYIYDSLRWNFDDPGSGGNNTATIQSPSHTYNSNGPRQVKLFIFSHDGCMNRVDTVKHDIIVGNKYFSLGNDTAICERDTLLLNATVTGALGYTWSTGANTPTIKIYQPGIYWCDVSFGGCIYRDSMTLSITSYPVVNLGKDSTLCEGQTLLLDAGNPASVYLWQDGSIGQSFLANKEGRYFVAVNKKGCVSKDTIDINYQLKPQFNLGSDKSICLGNTLVLDPGISPATYVWQDGTTTRTYRATQQGIYRVTVTNSCGSTADEISINQGVCELYVPNAFSPNGDGLNDVFKPGFGDNVTDFRMTVCNRYGQLIIETGDKTRGWNGTYKGIPQDNGTYLWQIQYKTTTNPNTQILQGAVLLIQ